MQGDSGGHGVHVVPFCGVCGGVDHGGHVLEEDGREREERADDVSGGRLSGRGLGRWSGRWILERWCSRKVLKMFCFGILDRRIFGRL